MKKTVFALALVLAALSSQAQDKMPLKRVAKTGDVFKYALQVETEWSGSPITFKATVVDTILEAMEDGTLRTTSEQTEPKLLVNGEEMDAPAEVGAKTTSTVNAMGMVVSMEGDMVSADAYRIANLEAIAWPKDAVGVGDKWEVEVKKDEDKGTVGGKQTFEVLAIEELGTRKSVKIAYESVEIEGEDPAKTKGTIWIDPETGLTLKRETEWTNVPIMGNMISGKVKITIIE